MEDKRQMFYGASPLIFERAKVLRQNMTIPEKKLWNELKANRILGLRFKSQHPTNTYIADFYCHRLKLVIEIDGENHDQLDQSEYDKGRTFKMEELGINTIRFSNNDVLTKLKDVLKEIEHICQLGLKKSSSSQSPLQGDGRKIKNNLKLDG